MRKFIFLIGLALSHIIEITAISIFVILLISNPVHLLKFMGWCFLFAVPFCILNILGKYLIKKSKGFKSE